MRVTHTVVMVTVKLVEKEKGGQDKMITKNYVSSSEESGFCTEVWSEITIGSQAWIRFV